MDYHCLNLKDHNQIQGRAQKKQQKSEIHRLAANTLKYIFVKVWQSRRTPEIRSNRVFLYCQFDWPLFRSTATGNKDGATLNLAPSSWFRSPKVFSLAFHSQTHSCHSPHHAEHAFHTIVWQPMRQSPLYFVCVKEFF